MIAKKKQIPDWQWGELMDSLAAIDRKLTNLNRKVKTIMSEQTDEAAQIGAIKDQLVKANTEIQAKIQALTDAAASAGGTLDPALKQAIEDLKPAAQTLDDVVPDTMANKGNRNARR